MVPDKVSLRPSTFVEGGAVPVDKNLLWKENRFALFDYTKKDGTVVATTMALRVTYVDDDGTEYVQHYSASDPERFLPSKDGKKMVPQGAAQIPTKSSNFYLLMNALINAGFPEDRIDDDISCLDGLKTFNIGMPEPKRVGLKREEAAEGARERVISVPSKIINLPWEKGSKTAAAGKKAPESDTDSSDEAMKIVANLLEKADSATRQNVATTAIRAKKPAVAKYVFTDDFQVALLSGGYSIDGDTITKA